MLEVVSKLSVLVDCMVSMKTSLRITTSSISNLQRSTLLSHSDPHIYIS